MPRNQSESEFEFEKEEKTEKGEKGERRIGK